ncbi:FtsX-like permease family protein [Humibacter ginsenosidimutans]|uniref:FtsX-like permease family protein n=1 Tax=Humibacter ginsenosidimutans TaxID=2599293 RepID=A0A5B8M237_9MICO|nr:FtsX-like permease family protein [Humibacter ginsenosidimutans]QDZ14727.1 FtsX-like permease family protein [Humibacter ginsenosidimutans]
MTTFWRARSARRRALLVAIGAAVFTLAMLLSLAAGVTQRGASAQVRHAFESVGPSHRSLTLTVTDEQLTARDEASVRKAIADAFGDAPVDVRHTRSAGTSSGNGTERWIVTPRIGDVTPADLAALEHGFTVLPGRASSALADVGGASASGGAAATTASIQQSLRTVETTSVVPLGVIGVAGAIAAAMLGRLMIVARREEDRLLRSRGASSALLVGRAAAEAVWIAVPAVVLAAVVAQVVLWLLYGAPESVAEVAVAPLAALVIAVAAMTAVSVPAAFRSLGDDGGTTRRSGAGTAAGLTALLLVFAALCTWRFVTAGSAAAVIRDPLAIVAPALVLCALAVLGTVLFAPIARTLELPLARGRGLRLALAARLTARNTAVLAAPIMLVALAVAVGTLASGTTSTSSTFLDDSARAVNGGAARLLFAGDTMLASDADLLPERLRSDSLSDDPGVTAVLRTNGSIGQVSADVLGVRAAELSTLVPVGRSIFDAAGVTAALEPNGGPIPGPVIPKGEKTLQARIVSSGTWAAGTDETGASAEAAPAETPTASVTLWLVDAAGDVAPLTLPTVPIGRTGTVSARLPSGGPWTIAATDVDVVSAVPAAGLKVDVDRLEAGGASLSDTAQWSVQQQVFDTTGASAAVSGMGVRLASVAPGVAGGTQVRVMPRGSTTVPVAVSGALAAQAGSGVGASTAVTGSIAGFQAKVVRVIPLVPGTTGTPAMLADLPTLVRGYLATSPQLPNLLEAWTTDARGAAAYTGARKATVQLPSTSIEAGFVALGATALWLGAAGAAVFALVAVGATIATLQRRRRDETHVLRQLGVRARDQARIRVTEPASATVFAVLAGAAAGLIAAALIAPSLARASAPSAPGVLTVVLTLDPLGLVVVPIAIVVVAALLLIGQFRATLADASGSAR